MLHDQDPSSPNQSCSLLPLQQSLMHPAAPYQPAHLMSAIAAYLADRSQLLQSGLAEHFSMLSTSSMSSSRHVKQQKGS